MSQTIKNILLALILICGFLWSAHIDQQFNSIDENTRATACATLNNTPESIANCISNE